MFQYLLRGTEFRPREDSLMLKDNSSAQWLRCKLLYRLENCFLTLAERENKKNWL